jgi:hypothetical protein
VRWVKDPNVNFRLDKSSLGVVHAQEVPHLQRLTGSLVQSSFWEPGRNLHLEGVDAVSDGRVPPTELCNVESNIAHLMSFLKHIIVPHEPHVFLPYERQLQL